MLVMPYNGTLFNWLHKTEEKKDDQGIIDKLRQDYIDMSEARAEEQAKNNEVDYSFYMLIALGILVVLTILKD